MLKSPAFCMVRPSAERSDCIYFLIDEAQVTTWSQAITLCMINKQIFICLQKALSPPNVTKSYTLGPYQVNIGKGW